MDKTITNYFRAVTLFIFFGARAVDAKLQEAHEKYRAGDWKSAMNLYQDVEPKNSAVWYNMGNCHYYQREFADAVVCWKRAYQGATISECVDCSCNIDCVRKKIGSRAPHSMGEQMSEAVVLYAPGTLIVQLIFILCWYALLYILIYGRMRRTRLFYSALAMLISIVLLLGITLLVQYRNSRYPTGIVVCKQASVYAGPHDQYHVVGVLQEIDDVAIYDKRPGFYKVGTRTVHGWVPADAVHIL